MENQDFDFVIHWNRFLLNIIGIWPETEEKRSLVFKCKFIGSILFMIYFIIAPQTADLFIIYSDMDLVVENLAIANITIYIALLKQLIFWYNGKGLQPLITYMKEDWINTKKEVHFVEMRKMGKISRAITIRLIILTQTMVFIFMVMNIYLISSGLFPTKRLFYRSYYPYNVFETPIYEITCLSQYFAATLAAMSYTGVDSFIGILVLHVCGQLKILQYELKHLADPVINGNEDAIDLVRKKLKYITIRHKHLNRFAETIEESFNMMFLAQTICLSLQLCFQGYSIYNTTTHGKGATFLQIIFFVLFILSIMSLFYLYCYVGDQLSTQTIKLGNAAYECKWYHLPPHEVKTLNFIMLRTNIPLCITSGKFCSFTMVTFCEVIKRSVGYLSVLLTVKQNVSNNVFNKDKS